MRQTKNLRLDKQHEGGKETQAGSDLKLWTLIPSAEHLWLNWDQSSGFQSALPRALAQEEAGLQSWAHEFLYMLSQMEVVALQGVVLRIQCSAGTLMKGDRIGQQWVSAIFSAFAHVRRLPYVTHCPGSVQIQPESKLLFWEPQNWEKQRFVSPECSRVRYLTQKAVIGESQRHCLLPA